MDIALRGFRSHVDSRFRISPGEITLIKGPSGVGKSTIMKAIQWVLYGNLRKVTDNTKKMKKCSVTLSIDNMFIVYRQKNPELLKLTKDGNVYEDKVAQSIIVNFFGTEGYWLSSSYLTSNEPCLLLSTSQKDKMRILNEIAITDEDPEIFLDVILNKLDEVQKQFDLNKMLYDSKIAELTLYLENNPIDTNIVKQSIEYAENDIRDAREKSLEINKRFMDAENIKSKYKYIEECITRDVDELGISEYKDVVSLIEEKQLIESKIENMLLIEQYIPDIETITEQIEELNLVEDRIVSDDDIIKLRETIQQYENSKRICQKYKLGYSDTLLSEYKLKLTDMIQEYPMKKMKMQIKAKICELDKKIETLPETTKVWDYDMLADLKVKWHKYNYNIEICKKWNIEYNEGIVSSRITELGINIKKQPKIKEAKEWDLLNKSICCLNQIEISNASLIDQYNTYLDAKKRKDNNFEPTHCPACSTELIMVDGILTLFSDLEPPSPGEVKRLKMVYEKSLKMFTEYQDYIQIKDKLDKLEQNEDYLTLEISDIMVMENEINELRLDFIEKPDFEPRYIEDSIKRQILINERLSLIETSSFSDKEECCLNYDINLVKKEFEEISIVKIIDEPKEDLDNLLKLRECNRLTLKLNYVKSKIIGITNHQISSHELKMRHKTLSIAVDDIIEYNNHIKYLRENIENNKIILTELSWDDSLIDKENEMRIEIETMLISLEHTRRYIYSNSLRKTLSNLKEEVKRNYNKLKHIKILRDVAKDIECETLQSTVTSMNETMSQVTEAMFDEPVSIKLNLMKQLKSKEITKNNVNITINLKGGEYENISELSNGERNRVNLAVTLALSRISATPFIMFDECLSSLDAELRERCLSVMRDMLGNKTILAIEHFVVEGMFDTTIALKN